MNKNAEARQMRDEDATEERPKGDTVSPAFTHEAYKAELRFLQIEPVRPQRHFIKCGDKILILLERRDATGTVGSIKRMTNHLSLRETRVVAPGGLVRVRKSATDMMTRAPSSFWKQHDDLRKESSLPFPEFTQKELP